MNNRDLNVYIAKHGISFHQLASVLGITEKTLYNYRKNERFPDWLPLALGLTKLDLITIKPFNGGDIKHRFVKHSGMRDICEQLGFDNVSDIGAEYARVIDGNGVEFLIRTEEV